MPRREPTLYLQALAALLGVGVALGLPNLSGEQAALIVAACTAALGVVNALVVRPVAPAAFTSLVGAVAALAAGYGFELSAEVVGSVNALVLAALALLTRVQVTPTTQP
jgi:uncharacterized protein (DUF697 family)